MTFEEFAEALRAEGFYRHDIPGTKSGVLFVRPLTGTIYCEQNNGDIGHSPRPNGDRSASPMWTTRAEALRMAKAREV